MRRQKPNRRLRSARLDFQRHHWACENRLHCRPDETFADDQPRLRKGFGASSMAGVRHLAFNLVRSAKDNAFVKMRCKMAAWMPEYLDQVLNERAR